MNMLLKKTGFWINSKINVNKCLDTLFLPQRMHSDVCSWIDTFINKSPEYKEKNTVDKIGICLHGIPGCGKSTLAYAIANQYKIPIHEITGEIFKRHDDNIEEIFSKITDSIVLFEEIDTLQFFNKRDVFNKTEVYQFLRKGTI